jgi:hypothetical protein
MIQIDIGTVKIITVSGSVNFGNTLHAVNSPSDRDGSPGGGETETGRVKKRRSRRRRGCADFSPPMPYPPGMWLPSYPFFGWMGIPFFGR